MKKHILFVDDEPCILDSLRRMLRSQRSIWEMTFVTRPELAWEELLRKDFDAVVSDVNMPGMSGLQLLERMRQTKTTEDVPVIVLTGLNDRSLKRQALDLGAADLLNKPVEFEELLARLQSVLRLKSYQDELRVRNDQLERRVQERTRELSHSRWDIIWRLGKAAECRDEETGNHVMRVGCFSRAVAEALTADPHFAETLFLAAPLHDIGKIGIPDTILLKTSALLPGEWEVMKQHCVIGANILREESKSRVAFLQWQGAPPENKSESPENPMLEMAASIALMHHEKWDGSGYPRGIGGEQIHLAARIVAISDVFDAMTSRRTYHEPLLEDEALEIIRKGEGTHFDPAVYAAFMETLPKIRVIRDQFAEKVEIPPETRGVENEKDLVCG